MGHCKCHFVFQHTKIHKRKNKFFKKHFQSQACVNLPIFTVFVVKQNYVLYFYISGSAAQIPSPISNTLVAALPTAWACGRSLAGIIGSNPAGTIHFCLL
jgi:hypothetical protein